MPTLEELDAENDGDQPAAPATRPAPAAASAPTAAAEPAPEEGGFSLGDIAHTAAEVVKPWGEYSPTRYVYERVTGQREAAEPERVAQAAGEGAQRGLAMGFDAPYAYLEAAGQWLGGDDRGYGELVGAAEAERAQHREAYPFASNLGEGAGAVIGGLATGGYGSAALAERAPAAIRGVAEALIDAGTQAAVSKAQGKEIGSADALNAAVPMLIGARFRPNLKEAAPLVKSLNAGETAAREAGEAYGHFALDAVPLGAIRPQQVWSESKMKPLRKALAEGTPIPPVRLVKQPDGTFDIVDGIHRVNAAMEAGLANVPAIVEEWVPADPMRKALGAGTDVLNSALEAAGSTYRVPRGR